MRILLTTFVLGSLILFGSIALADESPEKLMSAIRSQETLNSHLEERISRIREQIAEAEAEAEEYEESATQNDEAKEKIKKYRSEFLDLEKRVLILETIAKAYWKNFRPKVDFKKGATLEKVVDKKGVTFEDVTITGVDAKMVRFRHKKGLTSIPLTDLPPALLGNSVLAPQTEGPYPLTALEIVKKRPREIIDRLSSRRIANKSRIFRDRLFDQREKEDQEMREKERKEEEKKRNELMAAREAEFQQILEHNAAIDKKVHAIRQQISLTLQKRRETERAKSAKIREFNSARIKPDRRSYEAAIDKFNATIASYDAAITNLNNQVIQLFQQKK